MTLRNSILASFSTLVSTVVMSFFTGLCITRILEEEGRGIYSLLQADVTVLTFLLSFNIPVTLVYLLSKGEYARERIIGASLSMLLLGAIVVLGLVGLAFSGVIGLDLLLPGTGGRRLYLIYLAWAILYAVFQGWVVSLFIGLRKFKVVNRMNLVSAILLVSLYGGLLAVSGQGGAGNIEPVLYIAIFSQCALAIAWLVCYVALVGVWPCFVWDGPLLRSMLVFSALGYVSSLVHQLHYRMDVWFLSEFKGMSELGLYAVAVGTIQLFFMVPNAVVQVLNPHLIKEELGTVLPKFVLYSRLVFTLVFLGGIVAVPLSSWLLPLLYGEAFTGSVRAFQLLLPGVLFGSATKLLALLVIRSGKLIYNLAASLLGLACTVWMDLWLIPEHGLLGASVTSAVANFVVFAVVLWAVTYRLRIPMANYFILLPADIGRLWRS